MDVNAEFAPNEPARRLARLVSVGKFQLTRRLEIAPAQVVPALDAGFDVIFASVKIDGAEMQAYAIVAPASAEKEDERWSRG